MGHSVREFKQKMKKKWRLIFLVNLTYTYCINLVEDIIRHQKLLPTCRELPTVSLSYNIKIVLGIILIILGESYFRLEQFSQLTRTNISWETKIIIIIIIIFILSWCKIVKILIKTNHPVDTTIVSMLLSAQKKM